MELREAVQSFLTTVLEEFSYHPYIAPYLNVSRDDPPRHYIHQWEILARLSLRRPIRVLIGDEIGLGKTVTALTVSKYLEKIGRASRILVIVPRVLVGQWRKELLRIGVPEPKIKHLEREEFSFYRKQGYPKGYYIASMDLLKRQEHIIQVEDVPWDLVIIDEAHKLGYKTGRFWRLGKRLVEAVPNRDILFLSATPHRGDPKDYLSRLQVLDPYLTRGWQALDRRPFYEMTHGSLLFRRTKEDVNKVYEEKEVFKPARFYAGVVKAREDEVEFIKKLVSFLRTKLIDFSDMGLISSRIIPLLTILIFKRATSSPYAAMTTLERLIYRRAAPELDAKLIDEVGSFLETGYEDYEYPDKDPEEVFNEFIDATSHLLSERDIQEISVLRDMAKSIIEKGDSKLNSLLSLLEDMMEESDSKIIVFTEYKDTLNYIVENLKKRHLEWSKNFLRLCSEETRDPRIFAEIRNSFERDPRSRMLIATDVIAEGVNLQVAHILVNYEVPWSLIKLEQRIGRVWRLGQKKEVEAYTLFMNNVADSAALNSMYEKLLNLKRAALSPRPVTGQEVLLYAEAEDLGKIPPSVALVERKGKKSFRKVTEGTSILTYLRDSEEGLSRLIASIIAARQELEREQANKGILNKPKTKEEVEDTIKLLGFKDPSTLIESMKKLVTSSSNILGFEVSDEGEALKVLKGSQMPTILSTLDDFSALMIQPFKEKAPICLVAYGEGVVLLVPVEIRERRTGCTLYRELVGVEPIQCEILRGAKLLDSISQAISNCLGCVEAPLQYKEVPFSLLPEITDVMRKTDSRLLEPISFYQSGLSNLRLREAYSNWIGTADLEVTPLDPIGFIRYVKQPKGEAEAPSEELKKEVEEKAIELVIGLEQRQGRIVEKVSIDEHYDLKSTHPSTGDVRIIEVKGHSGPEVFGDLSEKEFELAEKESPRYWLYIVYNLGSKNPDYISFQDPLKTMNWEIFEVVEKRRKYRLRPQP